MIHPVALYELTKELRASTQGVNDRELGEKLILALVKIARRERFSSKSNALWRSRIEGALLGAGGLVTLPLSELNRLYNEAAVLVDLKPKLSDEELAIDLMVLWKLVDTRDNAEEIISGDQTLIKFLSIYRKDQLRAWVQDLATRQNFSKLWAVVKLVWRVRTFSFSSKAPGLSRKIPVLGALTSSFKAGQAMNTWHKEIERYYKNQPPSRRTTQNPDPELEEAAIRTLQQAEEN